MPTRPLLLAASLADRRATPDHAALTARALVAERAGLDLVVLEAEPLDPLLVAARLAAQTASIGIVPVTSATTTEPFHVSTALATVDVVARGRAGWVLEVDAADDVRGTVTWEVPGDVPGDAAEHLEAVRALWDSWEEGAVIRDTATDRFLDRDKVHHVDFEGRHLAVRGPSITPRPPQGHPPVLVRVTDEATFELARAHGDALLTTDPHLARGGGEATDRRDGEAATGRDPDDAAAPAGGPGTFAGPVRLLEVDVDPADLDGLAARLADEHAAGVQGVVLRADDLEGTLAVLLPALAAAGVRPLAEPGPAPDPTGEHPPVAAPPSLRDRLGLPAATNRFEVPA
ncbi:LLM class flavin-dependent oxidoreductase [Patulibacter sp.]|uniref:LLM class flavin-dependent oxidoreductase n=1 Tax=Patulibacter sp. TaxID=1912859 RepID=UPI00271844DB|nr:LLM class flavin-dependent oxidoreductase [Patulibacter sp.]MDO9407439.1 LLM class flavin-dependent oxidoreductase [Patulibacter sp.]